MAGIDRAGQGVERINVCFPKELADELRRYVPPRKRSELIIEGTIRMLAEIKRRDGLKAGAGAWSDEQHPELRSQEDVNRYLAGIRSSTNLIAATATLNDLTLVTRNVSHYPMPELKTLNEG